MLQMLTGNKQILRISKSTHTFEAAVENEWQCTKILKRDVKSRTKALSTLLIRSRYLSSWNSHFLFSRTSSKKYLTLKQKFRMLIICLIFQISVPTAATKSVIIMWSPNSLPNALQHQLNLIQEYFSLLKWFTCNFLIART